MHVHIYIYVHRKKNKHTHTHTHIYIYIYIYIYMWKSCAGRIRAPNLGVRHLFGFRLGADRISASTNSSAEFRRQHLFGFRLGADRISASTNSSAEFRRQAHFRLQAGGRPNFSFNEFERRIWASGTFSASGWWPTEFQLQRIRAPNFGVRHISASGWGPTEFQLQRIRAPNFGVRHIFGFRLGADRISASTNSSAEFRRQATFSASGWGPTEFQLQRIRAPNFGVRHIFGFRLGADRISLQRIRAPNFGVRHIFGFRLGADRISASTHRISASGTFSASGWGPTEFRLQRIRAPNFGVRHIFGFRPNLGFSAEFRRQDHFRLQSLAGSNIGAEFERQPIFGFSQHRPNLGAEFRLQNLSFRGVRNRDPLPRVPAYVYIHMYVYSTLCIDVCIGMHVKRYVWGCVGG